MIARDVHRLKLTPLGLLCWRIFVSGGRGEMGSVGYRGRAAAGERSVFCTPGVAVEIAYGIRDRAMLGFRLWMGSSRRWGEVRVGG
jgi:hypothetical protein